MGQPTEFGKRVQQAKMHAGLETDGELAKAVSKLVGREIPAQTIQRTKSSESSMYTAHIAHVCRVRPMWLAEGIGDMTERGILSPQHFKLIEDFKSLPKDCRTAIEAMISLFKKLSRTHTKSKKNKKTA